MASQSGPAWRTVPAVVAPLLVALFMVAFDNLVLWRALLASYAETAPLLTVAAAFVLITALFAALLQAVNFPWIFKPVAVTLLLLAAVAGYFMGSYGVIIDDAMFRNLSQTDPREAGELLTWRFFAHVLLFGVAIYILYEAYRRFSAPAEVQPTGMLIVAVLGLAAALAICSTRAPQLIFPSSLAQTRLMPNRRVS